MIDFERWDEIKPLVQGALDLPEEEQEGYLDEACQGDQELRRQAGILLAISATQADAYDNFVVMPPGVHAVDFKEGDEIGMYRIVRPLGAGGMSTVYLADDPRHERQVALKVLTTSRRRLHEERTVARFHHPHIVTLLDSGQIEDGPAYFVMEYIDGEAITTYCEQLSIEERLRLFLTVCDAVAYAHRHLVVHRDLKPANILVTKDGVLKLLDFGIAKSLSPSFAEMTATAPEDRALTVAFASPEQLSGETTSTATDIYSLGVLLCLLLTGRLPYSVKNTHELAMAIRVSEPKRPSQLVKELLPRLADEDIRPISEPESRKLARTLRGDLDAIVLKTLRKEPDRRYSTVAELAADVGHYLKSEPVSARRGSRRYRAGKFIRRHRPMVILTAVTLLLLIGLIIGLALQIRESRQQRDAATLSARRSAQLSTFLVSVLSLGDPFRDLTVSPSLSQLLSQSVLQLQSGRIAAPEDRAVLLETLGKVYAAQGNYSTALRLFSDALHVSRQNSIDSARLSVSLAATYLDLGKFEDARRALAQAAVLHQESMSAPQADVAYRLLVSGRERALSGSFLSASKLYSDALSALPKTKEQDQIRTTIHQELSQALGNLGQFDKGLQNIETALNIDRSQFHGTHPMMAKLLLDRAKLLRTTGRFVEAAADLAEAERVLTTSLGRGHPAVTEVMEERGSLAIEQQDYKYAEELFKQVYATRTSIFGSTHPSTLRAFQHLGEVLQGKGDLPRAESMLRKALADHERLNGDPTSLSLLLNNLGLLLLQRGNVTEATVLLERALHLREKMFGPDSVSVAVTKGNLALVYDEQGRRAQARQATQEAVLSMKSSLGERHPYVAVGLNNLGFFFGDEGDYISAIRAYREALAILDANNAGDKLQAALFLTNLGNALIETGQLEEAHKYIAQAQRILHEEAEPELPQRDVTDGVEGNYLLKRHLYDQAEVKLRSSYEGLKNKTGPNSRQTQAAARRLIQLYEAWGKPSNAAIFRKLLAPPPSH